MTSATRSPPVAFPVAVSTSGDHEIFPAAPTGFAWHVLGWALASEDVVTVAIKIGTKTAHTLHSTEVAAGGEVCKPSRFRGFPLIHEAAISLNLSDNVAVGGHMSAELVPYEDVTAPVLLDGGGASRFSVVEDVYA